jgi:hypothetical protein
MVRNEELETEARADVVVGGMVEDVIVICRNQRFDTLCSTEAQEFEYYAGINNLGYCME